MVHSLLRSMRWSPRKDDTLGCTRNALDNKYFPVSWFYLLLGTWELLAMGHSSSGWSQYVNANTWRMYIHNSTSEGRGGRGVEEKECVYVLQIVFAHSHWAKHIAQRFELDSVSHRHRQRRPSTLPSSSTLSVIQTHRDEEFLILRGQRWNEPGIGCDVTHEIWSPQSIKWIPVPCASSSCRCVNVFCTVHPFVFSTLSSSSSHPPTRVARETFQRNCDELCIEMFKASFDSLVSAVVRFVMLWVEGVHWVMTWTIAGELSEVYDCGWLHLRICLFAAYLQRLVNKIWPLE